MQQNKRILWYCAAGAVLCGILLLVGSFCDLPLMEAVYRKNEPVSMVFTVVGQYLFFGAFVFLTGGLLRQLLAAGKGRLWKAGAMLICGYCALSTSVLGAAGLLTDSCCGQLFDNGGFSFWQYVAVGAAGFYPLFFIGLAVSDRTYDKQRAKRLIWLLAVMTAVFFAMTLVKHCTGRPRYYTILIGYDGIGFLPWYRLGEGAVLREQYGLPTDHFGSFFSGHALNAVLNISILPAFALVIPALRGKERLLAGIAAVLIVPIAMSRMVLGAHFLSDLAIGGLVGISLVLIYERILNKSDSKG